MPASSNQDLSSTRFNVTGWRGKRLEHAHRQRRLIYNDDGWARTGEFYDGLPKDENDFLARRFNWTVDTQVDSYFWCIGNGADLPWGWTQPDGIEDCTTTMLNAARLAGQEAVISVRMNDIHDSFGKITYPFKLKNRHMLIDPNGVEPGWSALDYSFDQVREHKFEYISQVCAKYLPDGLELDFFRHPVYFNSGQEAKNLALMTDFVRDVRHRLDNIGQANNRPILLIVRLADTLEKSIKMGFDLPTWLKEDLLDVLIIGGGYAPFGKDWTQVRDLARQHEVPSYPCFSSSLIYTFGSIEPMRAAASNFWHLGAEGVYLFNHFVTVDLKKFEAKVVYDELKRLGDPHTLVGLDKAFCQDYVKLFSEDDPVGLNVMLKRMTADPPLPTAIGPTSKAIPLLVGDDLNRWPANKKPACQLCLSANPVDAPLVAWFNGKELGTGHATDTRYREYDIDAQVVRHGDNTLTVKASGPPAELTGAHLWVRYPT